MNSILNRLTSRPARPGGGRLRRSRLSLFGGIAAVGLALLSPAQSASAADYFVDFEAETKGSYASATVNLNGLDWNMTEALIGGLANDWKNGLSSARLRGYGVSKIEMLEDKIGGAGTISFDYRRYGSDAQVAWLVEVSDNGGPWTQVGSTFTAPASDVVQTFSETVDLDGNVRVRIIQDGTGGTSNNRLNVDDILITDFSGVPGEPLPPLLGTPAFSAITETSAIADASFNPRDGENFTNYGYIIALAADNADPMLGDLNVNEFNFDTLPVPGTISIEFTGLDPATDYAVRAYVTYDSGATTLHGPVNTLTTETPFVPPVLPELDGVTDYTEDFLGFTSSETIPDGWSVTSDGNPYSTYDGDWGTGTGNGLRGNASVFGQQHTDSTGVIVKTLTLVNETGATLDGITVSYSGRVARTGEGRSPEYTVAVNDVEVSALAYSTTTNDDNAPRSAAITDLNVAPGGQITITWTSDRGETSGASKQIGISDVVVATGASATAPALTAPKVSLDLDDQPLLSQTMIGVDATIIADGGAAITERGFVLAPTALEALPTKATANTTVIVFDESFASPGSEDFFFADFEGLSPSTSYSIRAYATNSVGTTYSGVLTQSTLSPPASLTGAGYDESFLGFDGLASLPDGWAAVSSGGVNNYVGDWGSDSAGGFRGPAAEATVGVLGYQHTGGTGTLTISLEMTNDTGAEINALAVSYLGRVERDTQTRLPIWTVAIDGVDQPALSYSTADGVDQTISSTITGLSIAEGATFTLTWSADRGEPGGSSRQIGLADVEISAATVTVTPPTFSVAPGTYFEDQTVSVSNFAGLGAGVEVRYTLDGSDPAEGIGSVYDDGTGILIEDGNGAVALRAVSVNTDTSEVSPIVSATYSFPLNVANIGALRASSTGSLYRVTGEITFTGGDPFRGTKYFQDASGFGIQIDDDGGVISTTYIAGDNVAGFVGTLGAFNNQLQLVPAFDPGTPVSTGNTVTPVVRTLDTLSSADQALLVRINGVEFESAGEFFGTGGQGTDITDPSVTGFVGRYRNNFGGSDITGAEIPTGVVDLIAIVQQRNADFNVAARSLADIIDGPILGDAFDDFVAVAPEGEREISDAPAGDGVANLFKYAFGGSPIVSDRSKLPVQSIVEDSGESYLGISFTPDRNFTWDAQSGTFSDGVVTLTVESSTDLSQGSWSPATGMVLVGGGTELTSGQAVTLRLSTAIDSQTAPRAFLRISGERVPAPL